LTETKKSTFGLDKNIAAAACYFGWWITGLIFFVSEKKDKDIKFHAMQSILFFAVIMMLLMVLRVFWFLGVFISGFVWLGAFAVWLILMLKAYQGEKFKLPVIGDIAEKQASK